MADVDQPRDNAADSERGDVAAADGVTWYSQVRTKCARRAEVLAELCVLKVRPKMERTKSGHENCKLLRGP